MNKSEIIDTLSATTGVSPAETKAVVNGLLTVVTETVQKGETVSFQNFGSFNHKILAPREGKVGFKVKKMKHIPERHTLGFKPCAKLVRTSGIK